MNFNPNAYRSYVINRRRYIPEEFITLDKDTIYYVSEDLIVTGWKAIRKRADISGGMSAYFPKYGIKTSKLFDGEGKPLYWYNDICEIFIKKYTVEMIDLLFDVVIFPDQKVKYMDIDEFAEAVERNLLTKEQECKALRSLHFITDLISAGKYSTLQAPILELEHYLSSRSC